MSSKSMTQHFKTHGFIARIAILCTLLVTHVMATDPPLALNDIGTYLVCASENQPFVLPRVCDVAYGANGKFVFKAAQSGTVVFNNATFGDPIPGVVKSGHYRFANGFAVSTVTTSGTGLTADCYDNTFVKGFPLRRVDATVNFPWYGAVPMPGVPMENFSVRWTGQIQARFDGDITLITTSDDGVKMWVDGQLIINDWTAHGNKENLGTFASLAGQKHDLRIEYYQGGGGSFMCLEWQSTNEPRTVVPATCLYPVGVDTPLVLPKYVPGTGTGLTGDYRNAADSIGSRLRRLDPIINFPWGGGSPDPSISADNFTVRWSGQIQTRFDGDCTLSTISDDGVRLFIDGKLLIDDWTLHGDKENTCTFASKAGQKHDIRIEYFESGGGASMCLKWQSANEGYTLVPTSCLYPYNVAKAIPKASVVSPAFFEGVYGVTLPVINTGILSDLGESQFYANVPLSATKATPVTLTEGSATASGNIRWTPTLVADGPALVIRKGDSLLLKFANAGTCSITNYSGIFLSPIAVVPHRLLPVLFSKAGEFQVHAYGSNGEETGVFPVTVVSVNLPASIACEVGFTRDLNFTVTPNNAPLKCAGNSQLTVTATTIVGSVASLKLTPPQRGTPRLLVRINGIHGSLVSEREIDEFTIDFTGAQHLLIHDPDRTAHAQLIMRPYVPDIIVNLNMFAHRSTFAGGATNLSTNTSVDFVRAIDTDAQDEIVGVLTYEIFVPPGENSFCHYTTAFQAPVALAAVSPADPPAPPADPPAPPVTVSPTVGTNGHTCVCTITFPCACTLQTKTMSVTLTGGDTEPWDVVLLACPDPSKEPERQPYFDMKGGPRVKGPITCDGVKHDFQVYTGEKSGSYKIFLRKGTECYECGHFCVFGRFAKRVQLPHNGIGTTPALVGPPAVAQTQTTTFYTGGPKSGPTINIPGGVGGFLLYDQSDTCGHTISIWAHAGLGSNDLMYCIAGPDGNGKVAECLYDKARNHYYYRKAECGQETHFTSMESINYNVDGKFFGLPKPYHFYEYNVCDNILKITESETMTFFDDLLVPDARDNRPATSSTYSGPLAPTAPVVPGP